MRADGRTDLQQWLTYAYERFLNATSAPDADEAIDGFPSLIDGFTATHLLSEPHQDLRVVVIVDAATFSAEFDLACQLHRMGAALVGTPPSQSSRR